MNVVETHYPVSKATRVLIAYVHYLTARANSRLSPLVALSKIGYNVVWKPSFVSLSPLLCQGERPQAIVNIGKSKVLVLGSRAFVNRINLITLPSIRVGDITLPFVDEVRNLGVIMTANRSWRSHVMPISRRVRFSLHKLKFHTNVLSRELRTTLVVPFISPLIDHCCLVFWWSDKWAKHQATTTY